MLVEDIAIQGYASFKEGEDQAQLDTLRKEMQGLFFWGMRRWSSLSIPEYCEMELRRVYDSGKGYPVDRLVNLRTWPLEDANREVLHDLDMKIRDVFQVLKGIGVDRPSQVCWRAYLEFLYHSDQDLSIGESREKFAGAHLVLSRLESTARIAIRYDKFDQLGPIWVWKDDEVTIYYQRDILRPELVRRGLMRRTS